MLFSELVPGHYYEFAKKRLNPIVDRHYVLSTTGIDLNDLDTVVVCKCRNVASYNGGWAAFDIVNSKGLPPSCRLTLSRVSKRRCAVNIIHDCDKACIGALCQGEFLPVYEKKRMSLQYSPYSILTCSITK